MEVSTPAKDPGQGDVFVAPKVGASQRGPMIIDPSGELVSFHPLPGTAQAFDFRAQAYDGEPVLTWWEGTPADFHGRGVGRIYDTAYRPLATVRAGNGYQADLHEFKLTPRGTALIAAYEPVPQDLSSVGGPKNGTVYDQIVQEVDVTTGIVLFEWHSVGSIELSESYQPLPKDAKRVYDPVHVNSIDEEPDGNLLVSARHTHTVYEIDRSTAKIRWRLGGKRSSFDSGGKKLFAWQHDARRVKRRHDHPLQQRRERGPPERVLERARTAPRAKAARREAEGARGARIHRHAAGSGRDPGQRADAPRRRCHGRLGWRDPALHGVRRRGQR